MIRRLRDPFGGRASREAADAAVGRGMADVLAALDNVVDDDAALGRIYAALGVSMSVGAPGRPAGTTAGEGSELESVITTGRARGTVRFRRRVALRSVAGVAAALAAGAVVLAVVPGARHGGTETPPVSAAYVVRQVNSALSAAEPGELARVTVMTRSGAVTAEVWSFGGRWRSVTYSAAGRPVFDEGVSASSVFTVVSYQMRAWARQAGAGLPAARPSGSPGCHPAGFSVPSPLGGGPGLRSCSPVTVPGFLRNAVSHGSLAEAGRQRIDGIEAIKLTSPPGSMLSETVWVSPRTYLPVRVITRPVPGQSGPAQTADIAWLPPTGPNLARLTVPVPSGFRELPLAEVTGPSSG